MKTVYLMGAGATKAVSNTAPLADDLLNGLDNIPDDERLRDVRNFIIESFGITSRESSNTPPVWPNIEDFLSLLDLAIQEQRPLTKDYDISHLQDIRNNTIYLISKELKESLERPRNKDEYNKTHITDNFVSKIDGSDSTIISFNYDLIIDNALLNLKRNRFYEKYYLNNMVDIHVNYGFKVRGLFKNIVGSTAIFDIVDSYDKYPIVTPLYKLHGSLNWLYCPVCDAIDIAEHQKAAYYIYLEKNSNMLKECRICKTKYQPLLITPTLVKRYDNRFIKQMWSSAEDCIRSADKLVFIGYSLSTSDYYIRYFINRALALNQKRKDGQLKVEVVTRGEGDSKTSKTEERYHRFFRNNIEFHPEGFEKYTSSIDTTTNS